MAQDNEEKFVDCMCGVVGMGTVPANIVFQAWAVKLGWGWFVAPTFNVIQPGLLVIIGLITLLDVIGPVKPPKDRDDPGLHLLKLGGWRFLHTAVALLIMWLVHLCL